MYSSFGKMVRKLMIDNDETLVDLATVLGGVSTAFVSAVLTGKKAVPEHWVSAICEHYHLDHKEQNALYSAYLSQRSYVKIDLASIPAENRTVAVQFQRKLPGLSEEALASILAILEGDDNGL